MLTNIYHLLETCNLKTVLLDKAAAKFFYSVIEKSPKSEGLVVDLVSVKDKDEFEGMITDKVLRPKYDLIVVKGANFDTLVPLYFKGIFIYVTGPPPKQKYLPFDYLGDCFEGYLYRNDLHSIHFPKATLSVYEQTFIRDKPFRFFRRYLQLIKHLDLKTIVEIGSCRRQLTHDLKVVNPNCCNDGHSTFFWAQSTCKVTTVDISPGCRSVLGNVQPKGSLNIVTGDGIEYLREYSEEKIDLLCLDSWDITSENDESFAVKHLQAYLHAKPKLSSTCFIVIDDTDVLDNGKGRKVVPQALKDGFIVIYHGRQTLLYRGDVKLLLYSSFGKSSSSSVASSVASSSVGSSSVSSSSSSR